MSRSVSHMEPVTIELADPVEKLRARMGQLAEVRAPGEAEEPILSPEVRAAVFSWLAELSAVDELKAAGLKPRSTALLSGPPGTGKTTLGHHLAARLGVPLVLVGAENLLRPYLGDAEQQMQKLFAAIQGVKAVVLLDEIEAIGRSRALGGHSGASEGRMSMLTVMLRKIEAFNGILIGATNQPGILDPALWRRFHLQLVVDLPGDDERFAIIRRYGLPFVFRDEDIDILVDVTDGASPALLRGLMEGLKRAIVLGPRMRWRTNDLPWIAERITAALAPPPEMQPHPPLWADPTTLDRLAAIHWPPTRAPKEDPS
ncbi:ATPase family associated with various cellular activities (AAA) [Pseudoxanthobacter soli DSM 19599]|uniref:ATPase family associated with various cellular activities (AAA) n=1 Tax=Pseudoxanthobacter soli DSM 19599 TaxID=1123029 RepID=A0A1M7ZM10_9HYPH|nr:ATP-binding protein [Pseudoxanthobacter soli]SHO65849.1 ATPase family associated with various cellular activities (AAA) [Pseudoxanthobacter soli DSM 19599]